jgi:hypothetical protein
MNFLCSEDLVVLVPFTCNQDHIAPLSRMQRDPNGSAPIYFNPIAAFRLRVTIPKSLQTRLLYSVLDFAQNP